MFFDGWDSILRTIIVGVFAYAGLVILVRVSGKRTLAKMNAFDLIVTVALGSTLATILLSRDTALLTGITAFVTLIVLQYAIAWLSVRSAFVRQLAKSEPRLLVRNGELLEKAMREERVTREEVLSAIRQNGRAELSQVHALILETDGTFSVIAHDGGPLNEAALESFPSPEQKRNGR
jgi:uncharacterized membrane protein YcaP (DUF421 family)